MALICQWNNYYCFTRNSKLPFCGSSGCNSFINCRCVEKNPINILPIIILALESPRGRNRHKCGWFFLTLKLFFLQNYCLDFHHRALSSFMLRVVRKITRLCSLLSSPDKSILPRNASRGRDIWGNFWELDSKYISLIFLNIRES